MPEPKKEPKPEEARRRQQEELVRQLVSFMPIIIIVLAIGFLLAGYFLVLRPKIGGLMPGGRLDFSQLEGRVTSEEMYADRLDKSLAAFRNISSHDRARVEGGVPTEPDIPGLFVTMAALAEDNGVLLTSVDAVADPKSLSPAGRRDIRVGIGVVGVGYERLKKLLVDIERSLRLLDIQTLSYGPFDASASIVLKAYHLGSAVE